ncbi:MAG TPA: DUF2461 domain-containing protein [Bacteroidota bacterium]|nr:DUF2461 domain-containing protein [Bacteroidota bacterium]
MKKIVEIEMFPPFMGFPKEGIKFLAQLKKNNNREWFNKHKTTYEECLKLPLQSLVSSLKPLMEKIAPEIEVNPRRSPFRIYRDIRFSKNKQPYKTHVSAEFPPKGHWEHGAGFYLHVAPNDVYVGGGIYMPDSKQLKLLRASIADNSKEFLTIVGSDTFKKRFGAIEGAKLQRMPLGYPADHMMGEWLKYKQLFAGVEWKDDVALSPKFVNKVADIFKDLVPFLRFLNNAMGTVGQR